MMKYLRRWMIAVLPRVGLLVASLLLVIVVGEVLARLTWEEPTPWPTRTHHEVEEGMATFGSLFDLAAPDRRGILQGVIHQTNDRGIRGPDRTPRPLPGVVRIGIGGDSITMGWGVEEPDTYVSRLERLLASDATDGRYEVLNFGLAGLGATAGIRRLAQYANLYSASVVIWGFTLNDIEGPHYVKITNDELRSQQLMRIHGYLRSPSYLLRLVGPRYESLLDRISGGAHDYVRELELNYFENSAAAADFEAALDVFAALAASRQQCGLILIHTHLGELGLFHRWHPVYEHVEQLGRKRNLTVVQSYEAFRGIDGYRLWVGPFDPHPNAEGHRIFSEVLHAGLRELPGHCLEASSSSK